MTNDSQTPVVNDKVQSSTPASSNITPGSQSAIAPTYANELGVGTAVVVPDQEMPPETDEQVIVRLAALSPFDYDRVRRSEARALRVQPSTLDAQVKAARSASNIPEHQPFVDVEPWDEPIDPNELLNEVSQSLLRYVVMQPEQADAVALWAAMTWFIDDIEVAPLLLADAAEKECGKSILLETTGRLVARPLQAANSTPSFLFRAIAQWTPTVLVDEADTFLRDNEELRGMVNAGHTRANAFVGRTVAVGDGFEPRLFSVWSAKAFAGIRLDLHLPAATLSRAIHIRLRRKMATETVARLRRADKEHFKLLTRKLARFAQDYSEQVRTTRPELPEALSDRAQDNWEPLIGIAACAGSHWVERAVHAALTLSSVTQESPSTATELLTDIRAVFEHKRAFKLSTSDLIDALVADLEKPWATHNRGHEITPRQLAKMLAAYDIRSKTVRMSSGATPKGFDLDQFADTFARYLPTSETLPQLGNAEVPPIPALTAGVAYSAQQDDPGGLNAFLAELEAMEGGGGAADTTGMAAVDDIDIDDVY